MRAIWKGIHDQGKAVDEALEACMRALGTPGFSECLSRYHEAARRLGALRVDLVIDQERQRRQQSQAMLRHSSTLRRVAEGD